MTDRLIHEQLVEVADKNPQLLVAYKNDLLIHDATQVDHLRKGDKAIWLCRDSGTEFFQLTVNGGQPYNRDPKWLTYWLSPQPMIPADHPQYLAFLVTVTKDVYTGHGYGGHLVYGTVKPITHERARALAEKKEGVA